MLLDLQIHQEDLLRVLFHPWVASMVALMALGYPGKHVQILLGNLLSLIMATICLGGSYIGFQH